MTSGLILTDALLSLTPLHKSCDRPPGAEVAVIDCVGVHAAGDTEQPHLCVVRCVVRRVASIQAAVPVLDSIRFFFSCYQSCLASHSMLHQACCVRRQFTLQRAASAGACSVTLYAGLRPQHTM